MKIKEGYKLILPDNYVKPVLPGRDEWLRALRSGEYTQGHRCLRPNETYCCLGVLSKIQDKLTHPYNSYLNIDNPSIPFINRAGKFPSSVRVEDGCEKIYCMLWQLNDVLKFTLAEIADVIEAVWENAEKNW